MEERNRYIVTQMSDSRPILNYHKPERPKSRADWWIGIAVSLALIIAYFGGIACVARARGRFGGPRAPIGPIPAVGAGQAQPNPQPGEIVIQPPATEPTTEP